MKHLKKLITSIILLTFSLSVKAQGLGISNKMDSFITSDLRPILKSISVAGIIIGGGCLIFYLFIGDGQRAKRYLGQIGWGVIAASVLGLIIDFVAGQSF